MKKYFWIIIAVFLLPINISAEEMLLPFFEDCADLSAAVSHSEKLMATPHTDEEISFTDDFSFIQRTELSAQWLVYAVPKECNITVSTYFWDGDALSHFNFYLSDDGESFRQVKPNIKVHPKIEGKWLTIDYKIKNTDAGYIKIEFGNLGGNAWNPAIRHIKCEEAGKSGQFFDVEDKEMLSRLELLHSLGILNGYEDGSFRPQEQVTRSQFVTAAVRLMNMSDRLTEYSGYTYFGDVDAESVYAPYINLAVSAGIIDVNAEKLFYPDKTVAYEEAAKILTCALGYRQYAEAVGGYPLGFISISEDIKLGRNVAKDDFSRGALANMLYNALEAPVLQQKSFGENIGYAKTEQALWNFHKVTSVTSLLTDNGITSLTGGSNIPAGNVVIGYSEYSCDDDKIRDFLGHRVKAYVNEDNEIICFTDETEEVVHITSDEADVFDNSVIRYNNKKISVTPNTRIIYNGEFLASAGDCNLSDYKPTDGEITVIGSPAEIIKIKNYTVLVTTGGGVFDKSVWGRFTGEHILNLDDCDFIRIIRDGEETGELLYNADEVIQIARSYGGRYVEIIITTDAVIGEVTATGEDEIAVDGKIYIAAPHYYSTTPLRSGESGYFYQDRNGKIVWGDIKMSPYNNYGYVIKSGQVENITGEAEVKLFTQNGKTEIFTIDKRVSTPAAGAVIKYKLSAEGKINKIEQAVRNYGGSSMYYGGTLASLYNISDTVIFVVPENKEDDESYSMRKKDILKAGNRYNAEIYDTDDKYIPKLAIVHQSGSELTNLTNYNEIVVITKISVTLNEKGDEVYAAELGNGKSLKFSSKEIEDITAVTPCRNKALHIGDAGNAPAIGDMLQYGTDENGDINAVRFLFTPGATDFYEWTSDGAVSEYNFTGDTAVFYGEVEQRQDGRIIASAANGRKRNLSVTSAAVFEIEDGKIKKADLTDINPGDRVACGILTGSVKIIVKN